MRASQRGVSQPTARQSALWCRVQLYTVAYLATVPAVIESITHKGLRKLFQDADASKLNAEHIEKLREILTALDSAATLSDLDLPTFKFHALSGDQKGRYSITVHGNWRVTFEFENGTVKRVNFEDYHKGKHR